MSNSTVENFCPKQLYLQRDNIEITWVVGKKTLWLSWLYSCYQHNKLLLVLFLSLAIKVQGLADFVTYLSLFLT